MKILVQGNLINTDYIYNISPIEEKDPREVLLRKGSGFYISCSFNIGFINDKSLEIKLGALEQEEVYDSCKERVKEIRDFVIRHWTKDIKEEIPSI